MLPALHNLTHRPESVDQLIGQACEGVDTATFILGNLRGDFNDEIKEIEDLPAPLDKAVLANKLRELRRTLEAYALALYEALDKAKPLSKRKMLDVDLDAHLGYRVGKRASL